MSGPSLVVLGVAQDGGHPQTGCVRPCCASVELSHRVACLGLIDGDQRYLVDCTPDVGAQLRALGAPPLHGILLTHAHMGHYTGLLQLGPEAWGARDVPVFAMPGMTSFLRSNEPWNALEQEGHVRLRPLVAEQPTTLSERLTATPWLVPHRGPWSETVAFVIRGPRQAALYLPDLDGWDAWDRKPAEVLDEVDVAYVDGSFFDQHELPWRDLASIRHPLVTDTMERLSALPIAKRSKVVFLHLNHTNPLLDPTSEASAEVRRRGFRVAVEGETLAL